MNKVISLNGEDVSQTRMDADVVKLLQEMLDRAKAGGIQSVALAYVKADGNIATRWAGVRDVIPMVAAISALHFEYMNGFRGAL